MADALPISAFIIALNEADRIARTVESIRGLADEVIVIDSGSTDGTREAAEKAGARVISHAWAGYGLQKRFGEDQCKNQWLLNLDADEIMSRELAEEIRAVFAHGPAHAGYTMRVCHMLPGETSLPEHTQINTCLRLYDKARGRFSDSTVHDSVIMQSGTVGTLAAPVYHPSYRSLEHAVEKVNRYSTMQAEDMIKRGQRVTPLRIYLEFPAAFFKAYFIRRYVFRGTRGFSYAMVYAFSRFLRLAKFHEMKDRQP